MENSICYAPAEMSIQLTDSSVINDIRRILKRINGVGRITVTRRKSELDLSLEDVRKGNVVNVGSVNQLMDYLHRR